jgi:hypothetical protein
MTIKLNTVRNDPGVLFIFVICTLGQCCMNMKVHVAVFDIDKPKHKSQS